MARYSIKTRTANTDTFMVDKKKEIASINGVLYQIKSGGSCQTCSREGFCLMHESDFSCSSFLKNNHYSNLMYGYYFIPLTSTNAPDNGEFVDA